MVKASMKTVWDSFTNPKHIVGWNNASDDWHTPRAENDARTGGNFNIRMEARDGSAGFDFGGVYDEVVPRKLIRYTMDDGRHVRVTFSEVDGGVEVSETFEAEDMNPLTLQRSGWQAILDNFKKYVEGDKN